ncbi:MAG: hypothetical protein SGARI_002247 [Bacillariaceae sp.]
MSFAGKSLGVDGRACHGMPGMPLLTTLVDRPIGGSCAFSQLDTWQDNGLNQRGSLDLWVSCGALVEEELNARVSSTNRKVLVVTFQLTQAFTNVDEKLDYLLDRINEAYHCNGDRNACLRILQNHSRYISAKANLSKLLGKHNERFLVEIRITSPFDIADALVTQDEDPICFGYCVTEDEETGESHIHMELKQFGKEFEPVTIDGVAKTGVSNGGGFKKTMFGGSKGSGTGAAGGMDSIPEKISFCSPKGKHRGYNKVDEADDDSSIESQPTLARREAFRATKRRGAPEAEVIVEDASSTDTEDEDYYDDNAMDTEEASYSSEVSRLRKEVAQLNNIVRGIAQSRSKDSGDSIPSTATSTAKKSKTNEGNAASVCWP